MDLTLVGSSTTRAYNERTPRSQSMFEQPSISWLYERGWRSSFAWAGFPGEQAEFDLALGYMSKLPSSASDSVLVDLSCGSGLFTRRFSASRRFGRVLGLDFSAAMLEEARRGGVDQAVALVRADAGRLPLLSGSVDVVHAGAAIHCWPSPLSAFAEVSRVLKPGGVVRGSCSARTRCANLTLTLVRGFHLSRPSQRVPRAGSRRRDRAPIRAAGAD